MNGLRVAALMFLLYAAAPAQQQHVQMNDGTKKYGVVSLNDPAGKKPYLTIDSTLRLDLIDVSAYQSPDGYFRKLFVPGLFGPDGFRFLKRTTTGRIDLYTEFRWTAEFDPVSGRDGAAKYSEAKQYSMITKPGFHLLPIDEDNVRTLTQDNARCRVMLEEYTMLDYYKYGALGAGVVTMGIGASKSFHDAKPYLIGGAVTAALAVIPWLLQDAVLHDVIEEYNR